MATHSILLGLPLGGYRTFYDYPPYEKKKNKTKKIKTKGKTTKYKKKTNISRRIQAAIYLAIINSPLVELLRFLGMLRLRLLAPTTSSSLSTKHGDDGTTMAAALAAECRILLLVSLLVERFFFDVGGDDERPPKIFE